MCEQPAFAGLQLLRWWLFVQQRRGSAFRQSIGSSHEGMGGGRRWRSTVMCRCFRLPLLFMLHFDFDFALVPDLRSRARNGAGEIRRLDGRGAWLEASGRARRREERMTRRRRWS